MVPAANKAKRPFVGQPHHKNNLSSSLSPFQNYLYFKKTWSRKFCWHHQIAIMLIKKNCEGPNEILQSDNYFLSYQEIKIKIAFFLYFST